MGVKCSKNLDKKFMHFFLNSQGNLSFLQIRRKLRSNMEIGHVNVYVKT